MRDFEVMSMTGDYPVEAQPLWDKKFETLAEAIEAAKVQQFWLSKKYPNLFTVVGDSEEDTMVEWLIFGGVEFVGVDAATKKFEELVEY